MYCISKDLRDEHDIILFGLTILEQLADLVRAASGYDEEDLSSIVAFFKTYSDKYHQGKEERLLFPAMQEAGILNENGPVGSMLHEHAIGRAYFSKMEESILKDIDKEKFADAAEGYAQTMRGHIDKENNELFPLGDRRIPIKKQIILQKQFEEFENEVVGVVPFEKTCAYIDYMEAKYLQ